MIRKLIFIQKTPDGKQHAFRVIEADEKGVWVLNEGNNGGDFTIGDRFVSWDELIRWEGRIVVLGLADKEMEIVKAGGKELNDEDEKANRKNELKVLKKLKDKLQKEQCNI